jgi:hypothetical protein
LTYRKRQQLDANQRLSVDNQAFLREVSEARQLIGWPQVVQQEMQLATNQLDVLRWKVAASYARSKPRLDGVLEESFWHQAPPMVLTDWQSDQLLQPPLIRWGYDASYLYFGIEVPRVEGSAAQKLVERREYDSELSLVDHIHIWLDTDRDYSTAIELAVSEDGRTYDRCCGDKSYNPKWHVSVRPESNRWTAEVAIELPQLTQETMLAGSAWAVSASRKHPNGQAQSWSQLRTHTHQPYGSGLLLFIPEDTSELSP